MHGFEHDFMFFVSCAKAAEENVITCYDDLDRLDVPLINYPPVYIYILSLAAHGYHLVTDAPLYSSSFLCVLKLITIFFELLLLKSHD